MSSTKWLGVILRLFEFYSFYLISNVYKMNQPPIIVEEKFQLDIGKVWKAITELNQMTQWFFENIPDFKPEVGFETQFNVKTPERDFLHVWKITEVEPLKKITYSWKYKGYSGEGTVIFELMEEERAGTKLRLTCIGIETFPQEIPEFTRESCEGGWNYFINERLKTYLEV